MILPILLEPGDGGVDAHRITEQLHALGDDIVLRERKYADKKKKRWKGGNEKRQRE